MSADTPGTNAATAKTCRTMSLDLHNDYQLIRRDVTWLHAKWKVFRQVYAKDEENYRLMGEMAPTFFRMVQDVFLYDFFVSIGRLTDRPASGGNTNLTLYRLIEDLDASGDAVLAGQLRVEMDRAQSAFAAIRTLRNKKVAHQDLLTARGVKRLSGVTMNHLSVALGSMVECLHAVDKHYGLGGTEYDDPVLLSDGKTLIACLRQAEAHRNTLLAGSPRSSSPLA